jgi:hypothetical protein
MSASMLAELSQDNPPVARGRIETFTEVANLITQDSQPTFSSEE